MFTSKPSRLWLCVLPQLVQHTLQHIYILRKWLHGTVPVWSSEKKNTVPPLPHHGTVDSSTSPDVSSGSRGVRSSGAFSAPSCGTVPAWYGSCFGFIQKPHEASKSKSRPIFLGSFYLLSSSFYLLLLLLLLLLTFLAPSFV